MSRDRLVCVVCIFSVRWGRSCLFMGFWGWLVFSPLGQCNVWFSVCRCIWVTYFSPILVFLVLIVLFVISGVSL